MDYPNLLLQADHFFVHSYRENHHPQLCFHTMDRVGDIVNAVATLSERYNLTEEDNLVINCAAYFQDIGYLEPYRLFCEKINCRKTVVCLNY